MFIAGNKLLNMEKIASSNVFLSCLKKNKSQGRGKREISVNQEAGARGNLMLKRQISCLGPEYQLERHLFADF